MTSPRAAVRQGGGPLRRRHGRWLRRSGLLGAVGAVLAIALGMVGPSAPARAAAATPKVAIPAYFYPMGDNLAQWQQLRSGAPQVGLAVATGLYFGTSGDTNYQREIRDTRAAGITVLGYVNTSAGTRDVAAVRAEIDKALDWYEVDGIFFDQAVSYEAPCTEAPWYADLDAYVNARRAGAFTVMNHGSTLPECFANAADVLLTAEHDWAWYRANYRPRGWEANYPASRFWHIVHSVPTAEAQAAIDLMRARHTGWITVTDRAVDAPAGAFGALPSPTVWQAELDAATVAGPPLGAVDPLVRAPGGARLSGWAVDPDTRSAAKVSWAIDGGQWSTPVSASATRVEAGLVWPTLGTAHGFSALVRLAAGAHEVCVRVHDLANVSRTTPIGCRSITVSGAPVGVFETLVRAPGGLRVTGWSLDPDTTSASRVALSLDGGTPVAVSASVARTDLATLWPGYGTGHGLSSLVRVTTAGLHTVCATALDVTSGQPSTPLGCRSLVVTTSPVGALESVIKVTDGAVVKGWALDPDTASASRVAISVDGLTPVVYTASVARTDVGALWPGYGTGHGLSAKVTIRVAGVHTVCATALDTTSGHPPTPLGCLPVVI